MKILRAAVSVSLVFALSVSPNLVLGSSKKPATNSKQAMLENMSDPEIFEAFHRIQLNLLQTEGDAILHRLFSQNPAFRNMYNYLINHNDVILEGFELNARSNMIEAKKGLTPKYDLLDKLIVDVATSLGFSKEVVNNRKIYISSGGDNAFTVSGSQNRIIVAFQRDILRNMTRSEIAGVLAHELGHIRAQHIIKNQMNSILLTTIGEMFVDGSARNSTSESKFSLQNSCGAACAHGKNIFAQPSVHAQYLDSIPKGVAEITSTVEEYSKGLQKLNPEQLQSVFGAYLTALIQIGRLESAPPRTLQYLQVLQQNLGNTGVFKVNPNEFNAHADAIIQAISRTKEKTADRVAASTVRNEHMASAFVKLAGLDFEKEYRPGIFDHMRAQAKALLESTSPEEMFRIAGSTHPALILRVNAMLTSEAVPAVMFANPFMRHFLIYESLVESSHVLKGYLDQVDTKDQEARKEIQELQSKIEAALAKQQRTIRELLFAKHVSLTTQNSPRLDNAIQFLTATRETRMLYVDKLEKAMAERKGNPEAASEMEYINNSLKNHSAVIETYDRMILSLAKELSSVAEKTTVAEGKANLTKKIELLKQIPEARSTAELEAIRAEVTKSIADSNRFRRTRIPLNITTNHVTLARPASSGGLTCAGLFAN